MKKAEYTDTVRSPKHYKLDGLEIESIDVVSAVTGDQFEGFCVGNILKYVIRYKKKNGVEGLKKARVYLDWLIPFLENAEATSGDKNGGIL